MIKTKFVTFKTIFVRVSNLTCIFKTIFVIVKTKFVIFRTTFVIIKSHNPLYIKTFHALKTYKHVKYITKQLIYKTNKTYSVECIYLLSFFK